MIARAIQEKTGTPARDAPLRGKQPAVTAKCSRAAACFTTKKSIKIPFRRELFTFSTGFSTVFVKKKPSFPRGFPLFPPGFPQENRDPLIHAVMQRGGSCQFLGRKVGTLPFIKKKVEVFSSLFTVHTRSLFSFSPDWKKAVRSFPHPEKAHFLCGKNGENCSFPPPAAAPCKGTGSASEHAQNRPVSCVFAGAVLQAKSSPEKSKHFSGLLKDIVTSYCGTPAVRSGSTGSGCRRPRWW